jgi:hypothetical protein
MDSVACAQPSNVIRKETAKRKNCCSFDESTEQKDSKCPRFLLPEPRGVDVSVGGHTNNSVCPSRVNAPGGISPTPKPQTTTKPTNVLVNNTSRQHELPQTAPSTLHELIPTPPSTNHGWIPKPPSAHHGLTTQSPNTNHRLIPTPPSTQHRLIQTGSPCQDMHAPSSQVHANTARKASGVVRRHTATRKHNSTEFVIGCFLYASLGTALLLLSVSV